MTIVPIIGGGVAGLVAAAHLAARGLEPVVFEAHPARVGGRLRDEEPVELSQQGRRWSFPGEHGIHGIWSGYVNFRATLERFGLDGALIPADQETWIHVNGARVRRAGIGRSIRRSLVPAPFHYYGLLLNLPFLSMLTLRDWVTLPRIMGSFVAALAIDPLLEQKALKGMSLADFTADWSPRMRAFFAGLARNALAARPEEIPAAGFISFLRFYTLLRRDAWAFSYLNGTGGQRVCEPLAEWIRGHGGRIELGRTVTSLERTEIEGAPGWRLRYESADGPGELAAPCCVLALDAPATRRLLEASPATAEAAARLSYPAGMPTAIFRLWFGAKPRRGSEAGVLSGDVTLDNFFWMDRLIPTYREWAEATGGSAVEAHIYGPAERLAQPDPVLLTKAVRDLTLIFPELRGTLIHGAVQRNAATHTLFGVGDREEFLATETPWPGLYACGDWIAYPSPALYLERATVTGIGAADAVLRRHGLEPWEPLPAPEPEWLAGKLAGWLQRQRQRMLERKRRRLAGG